MTTLTTFITAVVLFTISREVVDRFFNLYTTDRAVAYGFCGGFSVWALLAVYFAPLL